MSAFYNILGNVIPSKDLTVISTTGTSGANDTGTTFNFTGSSSYTYNLNIAGLTNPILAVGFQSNTTSNAIVTLTPTSGTLQGQASVAIGTGDSGVIRTNNTNAWFDVLTLQPANCRAYSSTSPVFPATGSTLTIPFNTVTGSGYDIGGFFNTGTNTYTPLLPGKYRITAQVDISITLAIPVTFTINIYKNGAAVTTVNYDTSITGTLTMFVEDLIPMNGSTDAITIVVSQTGAATQTVNGGTTLTFFTAKRDSLF